MAEKVIRTKTKTPGIYFNENTKKYDVKYNYKVYDPNTKKNSYKAQWEYGIEKLGDAKETLAKLKAGGVIKKDEDITLDGVHELWKIKAKAKNYSKVSIRNTQQQVGMIYQFLPKDTKLKDINEELYYKLIADCREHGYAEETLHNINACFRKMINLAYKKKLIAENPLDFLDNVSTKQKQDYVLVTPDEFEAISKYYADNHFIRLGVDRYKKARLLFNLLYYTGLRIGEAIALTYEDFEMYDYHRKDDEKPIRLVPTDSTEEKHMRGMVVNVTKAYLSEFKETKDPKNIKHRKVPVVPALERLFLIEKNNHLDKGGSLKDRIFPFTHSNATTMIRTCVEKLNLGKRITCHSFRHTYISNLISKGVPLPVIEKVSGDTQETIIKRYSHLFENDIYMVVKVMQEIQRR